MSKINVSPLYEGTFSVGVDHDFNRIGREDAPKKGALKLSINPFLIADGHRNILFDAGLGDLFGGDTSISTIQENLAEHSISDYEITDIFISHLHFDHIGGLANRENGYWELTFPDAKVWVSGNEWKKLHAEADKLEENHRDFFHFIDSKADLKFLNDKHTPLPNVRVEKIGGHTEFHLALFYENGDHRYLMAGDVIGRRIAINQNFMAKYDFDPKQSMKARTELKSLAYEKGYTIMAYHETDYPLFKLKGDNGKKGFTIENIK